MAYSPNIASFCSYSLFHVALSFYGIAMIFGKENYSKERVDACSLIWAAAKQVQILGDEMSYRLENRRFFRWPGTSVSCVTMGGSSGASVRVTGLPSSQIPMDMVSFSGNVHHRSRSNVRC